MNFANLNDRSAQGFAIGNGSDLRVNAFVGEYQGDCLKTTEKHRFMERGHVLSGSHLGTKPMATAWQPIPQTPTLPAVSPSVRVVGQGVVVQHSCAASASIDGLRQRRIVAAIAADIPAAAWATLVLSRSTTA
ncbi:MAG: hypothetical protein R3C01_07230 [Planctomycetaceae bacterium]